MIQDLNTDLETGSHHWNNLAAEEFHKKHKYFCASMEKLFDHIENCNPNKGEDI